MKIQLISNDTVKTIELKQEKTYQRFLRRIVYETELFLEVLFNESAKPMLTINIAYLNMRTSRTLFPNYFEDLEMLTGNNERLSKIKITVINGWIKKELDLSGAQYFFDTGINYIGQKVIDRNGNISKIVKNIGDKAFIIENDLSERDIVSLQYVIEHVYKDEGFPQA